MISNTANADFLGVHILTEARGARVVAEEEIRPDFAYQYVEDVITARYEYTGNTMTNTMRKSLACLKRLSTIESWIVAQIQQTSGAESSYYARLLKKWREEQNEKS